MKCCGPTPTLIIIISGVFICSVGIALKLFVPELIVKTIAKSIVISKTSASYEAWVTVPFTMYTKYYFFNYTNADEFARTWENGTKPRVEQLGPYIYRHVVRYKDNITFYDDDNEVEYYVKKALEFVPEMSNGTEQDILVFPNMVLRTVAYTRPKAEAGDTAMLLQMTSCKSFLKHTVGELLFDGYVDEVFQTAEMFTGVQIKPGNKFHMMDRNTTEGPIRVKTGHSDINEIGKVVEYNNKRILDVWPKDSSCNQIRGGDGGMFPPRVPTDKNLEIFIGGFCRSLALRFVKEVDHFGMKANRFVLDSDALANTNKKYECFCQSEMNYCRGSGVYNLGSCTEGAQLFISLPHLLNTDYHIRNAIDGLAPDPDKHVFQFDIEKITGMPVNASINIQMNFGISRTPWLKSLDNLPEIILPIMWMSDGASINESMAEILKSKIYTTLMLADMIPLAILGLGGILGASGIICSIYYMFKGNRVSNTTQVQPFQEKTPIKAYAY